MSCDRFAGRVGYKGQKYGVYFTRDGEEHLFGWQNEASGGLERAASLMPGVTSTRVLAWVPFTECDACWCQPYDVPANPDCPMHGATHA